MLADARRRVRDSAGAFGQVFRNAGLRRLELAWAASTTGEWASLIALSVFAFESGGAAAVGLANLIRLLPAAVAAPFAALLADRFGRARVMVAADVLRALAIGGAAASAFAGLPAGFVYGLAGLVAVVSTAFRPAQAALVPTLARTPSELTAANVVSSTIESVAFFAGPAAGGLLLAATSVGTVFVAQAAAFVWSAVLVSRIRPGRADGEAGAREDLGGVARQALGGFRAIGADSRLRVIVGLFGAQTLVHGALTVLVVLAALDLFGRSASGVGLLASADGIGGLVGAAAAVGLVATRRLGSSFALGIVVWGAPIALIGLWPRYGVAFACLAVVGVANTIVDVAGLTLLQRAVPNDVLARVFGVLESLVLAAIALGSICAPLVVDALGVRGAFVAFGLFLPAVIVLLWRRVSAIDAASGVGVVGLDVLRSVPIFGPLPEPTLEALASRAVPVRLSAGEILFRQGEPGDRFYVVEEGELEITVDERRAAVAGPGGHLGEIALLRAIPRTATVTARSDARLYAFARDDFVAAVSGHPASSAAADAVIATRLASLRPSVASL